MGMLDRLLGDLVASSTNLSPRMTRRLVRKAGGGKLLLAGGAALAGALLTQHLQSRQTQPVPVQPVVPPPPPVPPPGPGTFTPPPPPGAFTPPPPPPAASGAAAPPPTGPEPGWSPPPPPGAPAPAEDEIDAAGEVSLPPGLLFPVVRTMVAAALADGELEPAERESIFRHLESGELTPSEVAQLRRDLVLPPTPVELAALVRAADDGEVLYRFAFLTLRADGEIEAHEEAWLEQLTRALGIEAGRTAELEAELEAGEPWP